jgi:hypothetical protein
LKVWPVYSATIAIVKQNSDRSWECRQYFPNAFNQAFAANAKAEVPAGTPTFDPNDYHDGLDKEWPKVLLILKAVAEKVRACLSTLYLLMVEGCQEAHNSGCAGGTPL